MKVWLTEYWIGPDRGRIWHATKKEALHWIATLDTPVQFQAQQPKPIPVPRNGAAIADLLNKYGDANGQ